MPELPEVETTLRGIAPHIHKQKITDVIVRNHRLRLPIRADLKNILQEQTIHHLFRRGKFIVFSCDTGALILHLGMSGRVSILSEPSLPQKHDHVELHFANKKYLRYTDPRRFGVVCWTEKNPSEHSLLANIGPEPLAESFVGETLWTQSRKRKITIKQFIMDSKNVAGVGNIYAAEALFRARIKPHKAAGKLNRDDYAKLVEAIKAVLTEAIAQGGTTLKDFADSDGKPGYFSIKLNVYGRAHQPCYVCQKPLKLMLLAQRSTVYCNHCQKS